jgi:hypothetical protein
VTSRAPWVDVLAATAIAAAELGGAIGLHVWFDGLPHDERPIPTLAAVPWVLVVLAGVAWVVACLRVAARRSALGDTSAKIGTAIGLLGQLALTLGGTVVVVLTDPEFLFGSHHDDTLDLPDGRSAYLYRGGLFCAYEIFVSAPDDLIAFRTRYLVRENCDAPAALALEGDTILIVDEHGQPLADQGADWSELLLFPVH